ncbi:MFS transporter [Desulfovibrio sp. OttesenSCG-928-F20]|nr:MFS transporter [Desulfovibrio sp. OttesenSCG-928-F20]
MRCFEGIGKRPTLLLVIGLTLTMTMGISSLVPSLPMLAREFGLEEQASWRIIATFALPGLVCIPFVGVWADRYGRKKVLIPGLFLFCIGSLACCFAQSFDQMLAFRFIQGAGSAPLGLLYSTIVADTWQGEERARVMSLCAVTLGFGTALSPVLGGALTMLNWRLVFLLPLLALPLVVLAVRLPLMRPVEKTSLALYAAKSLALARQPQTLLLLALTLLTFIMLSGPVITCFPLLAESLFQARPLDSGLIISAASLASGLSASYLPRLYKRYRPRTLLLTAMALYTAAFCIMPHMPGLFWLIGPLILYGLAQGLNIPLVSTLLVGQAPDERRAALMALNALLLRLGQYLGPAIFGTLVALLGPGGAITSGALLALVTALLLLCRSLPDLQGQEQNLH